MICLLQNWRSIVSSVRFKRLHFRKTVATIGSTVFPGSSKARRLAKAKAGTDGGVSVEIHLDNTIAIGQPWRAKPMENEYMGEEYLTLEDEEYRRKGDKGVSSPKAGVDEYDEVDDGYLQPKPEKAKSYGKQEKGASIPKASPGEYNCAYEGYLQLQDDEIMAHGKNDTGMGGPDAVYECIRDIDDPNEGQDPPMYDDTV